MRKPPSALLSPRDTPRQEPTSSADGVLPGDAPPPSSSSSAAVRGAVDALVQGSMVDLFEAYSVALAPQPRSTREALPKLPELCAYIGFNFGPQKRSGRLTLSLSPAVVSAMKVDVGVTRQADWARELCNQLMGRIKNRMLPFNVRLQVGLPSTIDVKLLEEQLRSAVPPRVYVGRTLRGDVLVTLDGMPHEAELVYVGPAPQVPSEGDTLFF